MVMTNKDCELCDINFNAFRVNQRFCSKKCMNKNWSNNNPEKISKSRIKWNKSYPEKKLALTNKRRAKKLNATPKWITPSMSTEIEIMYLVAQTCTRASNINDYHVDHIIPLQGKEVCGLHIPINLQIITAKDNIKKSNKVIGEKHVKSRL